MLRRRWLCHVPTTPGVAAKLIATKADTLGAKHELPPLLISLRHYASLGLAPERILGTSVAGARAIPRPGLLRRCEFHGRCCLPKHTKTRGASAKLPEEFCVGRVWQTSPFFTSLCPLEMRHGNDPPRKSDMPTEPAL